jgi:hypothetical protein
MSWWQRILHRPFFIRLMHWEYWSFHTLYIWVYPVWFYFCLRSKSFFFFSASNPSMENGGFLMESKKKIYDLLPPQYYPKTVLVHPGESPEQIIQKFNENHFVFPVIAKPDIGGKGRGVKKISCESDLIAYLQKFPVDMLIQEFVPFENEIGVFYFRCPREERGAISGIVGKDFLKVRGDGRSTIEQLLKKDKRHILQLPVLTQLLGREMDKVLPAGQEEVLVPYGNHARGAMFVDHTHLADTKLVDAIDHICKQIPGFYFGRLDIRYQSLEKLRQGIDFSLIEVNGAGSEPTHMYDPRHTVFHAWKEIVRHWKILYRISNANHKNGIPFLRWSEGVQMFRQARQYDRILAKMDAI